MDDLPRKNGI
jgi:hypothetical protein